MNFLRLLQKNHCDDALAKVLLQSVSIPAVYKFAPDANNKIVYISGAHGSGKSTLIEDLRGNAIGEVREQIAHMEGIDENVTRQVWRIALHCIEHRENLALVTSGNNSLIIGDRCYIDDMAYMSAFRHLGWFTEQQFRDLVRLTNMTYQITDTPKPRRFIIVTPPLDWNISRIEQRWQSGERTKWRERDFNYLAVVMAQYVQLAQQLARDGFALQVTVTDRDERTRVISQWLNESRVITSGKTFTEGEASQCISD